MSASTEQIELFTSLKARALKAYATKDYATSSDLYAQACELQSQLHGSDDDPRNANLLYLYGRALYQLAQSKSDVLGGGSSKDKSAPTAPPPEESKAGAGQAPKHSPSKRKAAAGLIAFDGDSEDWQVNDEEQEDGGQPDQQDQGDEDEDDDLQQAWDILDLSRVLFERQLPTLADNSEHQRNIRIMLSDVYDLLGEVSLEAENFSQAAKDLRHAKNLKLELYAFEHSYVAEACFKLGLALEFMAAGDGVSGEGAEKLREEAAQEMEAAVKSCEERIRKELAKDAGDSEEAKGKGKAAVMEAGKESRQVKEVREMVAELKQRIVDLRNPPPEPEVDLENPINGLLGQLLGKDPMKAKARIEEAVKGANDVSGLVRKKKKQPEKDKLPNENGNATSVGAKRKLDDLDEETEEPKGEKKVRVEEAKDRDT